MANIVILGGSFAGVSTAHRILKGAAKTGAPVKITLVSPNTHFYWNIAAPRAIIPGQLADEKYFQPIAAGFSQYKPSQFEFIVASAESVDFATKKGNLPFKTLGTTEATKDALHDFQARVKKAKTIVVAGAGATGVETAGELGFEYGTQKEIILIAGGSAILEQAIPSVSKTATKLLEGLKVNIKYKTKVSGSAQTPEGRQELTLASGDKLVADLYISTFGLVPNSSYVPAKFLNANGFVTVDEYLKVKGTENNIVLILTKKTPLPHKLGTKGMGLQIGRKAGTGHLGSIKLPGFLVSMLRKNLFVDNLPTTVNGSAF
ncbi:hypothetical protein V1523DRAFT_428982 [Lipomyces doorenjongii]